MFEDNAMDNGHFDERNKCFCKDGTFFLANSIYFLSLEIFKRIVFIVVAAVRFPLV